MSWRSISTRLAVVLTERVDVGVLSAYALVALGRHPYTDWLGSLTFHDHLLVQQALQAVGAQALAERSFSELSDGECQKIMIARALAQEPDLLILDEPTAFLDLPHRVEMMYLLRELTRKTNCSILLSTHDLGLALRCADRFWLLTTKGAQETGTPEDMVLTGALERAFASAGVQFDRENSAFVKAQRGLIPVSLDGKGVELLWTRRALEREGFVINAESCPAYPSIVCLPNPDSWKITLEGETRSCHSIDELITVLLKSRVEPELQHAWSHTKEGRVLST